MVRLLRLFPLIPLLVLAPPVSASGGESGGAGGGAAALEMQPLSVPIVDGSRMVGRLDLVLLVEPDPKAPMTFAAPVVRAALYAAAAEFARLNVSTRLPVDASKLSHMLDKAAHDADPAAARVLLIEVRTTPAG